MKIYIAVAFCLKGDTPDLQEFNAPKEFEANNYVFAAFHKDTNPIRFEQYLKNAYGAHKNYFVGVYENGEIKIPMPGKLPESFIEYIREYVEKP